MSRTVALLVVAPLALIIAVALLLPLLLDKDKILELASATLYEQTGITLTVAGDVELDLFPRIGVSLEEVSLIMPGEQQSRFEVRSLSIGVQLRPLLSGNIEIDTLSLDGLNSTIRQQAAPDTADTSELSDEQLDAFYARRRQELAEAGDAVDSQAILAVPLALKVQKFTLSDSRIQLIGSDETGTTVIELPSLEITGLNLEARPVDVRANIRLPGEQPIELALRGSIRIDQERQVLALDTMELAVTGATSETIELETNGEVDINRQVADLRIVLALGDTRGEGKLRYASFESPQIDTQLRLNRFDPALLALAGPEAAAEAANRPAAASGDEPLPLEAIRLVDTRAELAIAEAVFGHHTLTAAQLKLRALDGVIQVQSLTGELHGGKLDLQATFNGKHNTATLDTTGTLTGLDISTALAAMEAQPMLSGDATLDWQLTGKGRTVNELVTALKGPVRLNTKQVVLNNMGIEGMLCQAVALVNQEALSTKFPRSTRFETLSADIELADGKARLNPLRAELPEVSLKGTGVFELLSQDFKATFKAQLSPGLEDLDRACRVSKRLTAIDWPVRCKGNTASDPAKWCAVDTEEIIADLAKHEATRTIQKEAGKLLDKLFK